MKIKYFIFILFFFSCKSHNNRNIPFKKGDIAGKFELSEIKQNWWHKSVFYQIWPRSFKDSDGDGIGDFNGIIEKIEYLNDLGIDAIWLTPIFESPSYHGYDFSDFYKIEKDYGTMDDFKNFVKKAKENNVKIVLDLVLNHISSEHYWFKMSELGIAPYTDYFIWKEQRPSEGWKLPWKSNLWHYSTVRKEYYYGVFDSSQPDLNLEHPDVIKEIEKITTFWLEMGVDGFRLDAIRYAIEEGPFKIEDTLKTIEFWNKFKQKINKKYPDTFIVGEAWAPLNTTKKYYSDGNGIDSVFDFDFRNVVLELFNGQPKNMYNFKKNIEDRQPAEFFSLFLNNHDMIRSSFILNNLDKQKIAATLLFTIPGIPFIYYGEEISMSMPVQGKDIYNRLPMIWNDEFQGGFTTNHKAWVSNEINENENWWESFLEYEINSGHTVISQLHDENSLLNYYKWLIKQRKERKEFRINSNFEFKSYENGSLLYIHKSKDNSKTYIIINLTNQMKKVPSEFFEQKCFRSENNLLLKGFEILIEQCE